MEYLTDMPQVDEWSLGRPLELPDQTVAGATGDASPATMPEQSGRQD